MARQTGSTGAPAPLSWSFLPASPVMRNYCLLLLLLLVQPVLAACPQASLQQAFFSLTPSPTGATTRLTASELDSHSKLYFFSRVSGNPSGALLHRWRHDNRVLQTVRLQNGSADWQSWSAATLGSNPGGDWQVEVLDDHLCLLGKADIRIGSSDVVLAGVRKLLAKQDVTGAKLALKQALASPDASRADKRRWQSFMDTELVLAEVAADIQQQQFLAATGRLESLNGKLQGELLKHQQQLQQALQQAEQTADRTQLFALIAAIHSLAISKQCPANQAEAQAQLTSLLPKAKLNLTGFTQETGNASLTVMLPSGSVKQLSWPCQGLLVLP